MYFLRSSFKKLPDLTIKGLLSENMKIILKSIDPIKYKDLKIKKYSEQDFKENKNIKSPW
jgi:cellobiose-specific phosphotransferase system component IIB